MRSAYKTLMEDLGGRVILEDQRVNGRIILKLILKKCASDHFEDIGVSGRLLLKWILKEFGRDHLEVVGEDTVKVDIKRKAIIVAHNCEHGNEP
jgi:hypothetical protein